MRALQAIIAISLIATGLIFSCGSGDGREAGEKALLTESRVERSPEFYAYWNKGLAELSTYALEQARYGEMRSGEAVLIFVTEPFLKEKQVKADNASDPGQEQVLKLNFSRKFLTGIYPYSVLTSTFTPTGLEDAGSMLKATTSVQEWCGHTFTQINRSKNTYTMREFSYFESEGDSEFTFSDVLSEDELWSLIRIDPSAIPTGDVRILPSQVHQRFNHIEPAVYHASISLEKSDSLTYCVVQYRDIERSLRIGFLPEFPFEIEYWEETSRSGWGNEAPLLTTTGRRIERSLIDYWNRNHNGDDSLRVSLGLK